MFKKAYKTKGKQEITYERENGSKVIYAGGTPAWRNNNPGNLKTGPFTRDHGAISGRREKFAIFPDYETGRKALVALLKIPKYQAKTIGECVKPYAPKSDGNNPVRYRKLIKRFTSLDLNRKMNSLSVKELENLIDAIERIEGTKPGKVIEVPDYKKKQISSVRKNKKGTIVSYYVEALGWLSKSKAIALATAGTIDAVVATSRGGNLFLRTRAHSGNPHLDDLG